MKVSKQDLPFTKKIKFVGIVEYDDPEALVKSRAYILPDKPAFIGRFVRIDDMSEIIEEYEPLIYKKNINR